MAAVKTWSMTSIANALVAGRVRHATRARASVTPVLVPMEEPAMTMEMPSAVLVCLAGVGTPATQVGLLKSCTASICMCSVVL